MDITKWRQRRPLEDGNVTIARAALSVNFPSRFMLAAAMNPCPCGFFGDTKRECHCSRVQIQRYVSKNSGPLLDRIDIHIEVPFVYYKELCGNAEIESFVCVRSRVIRAREIKLEGYHGDKNIYANSQMPPKLIRKHCAISPEGEKILEAAIQRLGLSARAHDRVLKLSRTIADLEGAASPPNTSAKLASTAPSTAPTGPDRHVCCGVTRRPNPLARASASVLSRNGICTKLHPRAATTWLRHPKLSPNLAGQLLLRCWRRAACTWRFQRGCRWAPAGDCSR
jgi:hypothetical protein